MSMTNTIESEVAMTGEERGFALLQRQATAFATSELVPKAFQGNVPNCMIVLELAARIGASPLMIAQNLDVIHGRPSFRATFLIACINKCGRFSPLQYRIEGEGDDRTCVAFATVLETGDTVEGPPVSIGMAKAEGWATKNGSKWRTMADLMLRYRSAAFFARTVAPEVAMGLYTSDELSDMQPEPATRGASALSATDAIERAKDVTPDADSSDVPGGGPEPGSDNGTSGVEDHAEPGPGEVDEVDRAFGLDGDAA